MMHICNDFQCTKCMIIQMLVSHITNKERICICSIFFFAKIGLNMCDWGYVLMSAHVKWEVCSWPYNLSSVVFPLSTYMSNEKHITKA